MDISHFRQINLPLWRKAAIIHLWMRFIVGKREAVLRGRELSSEFVTSSRTNPVIGDLADDDPWVIEHTERLFWLCCELGCLAYQYPYPHSGQTYLPTRMGRIVAWLPRWTAASVIVTLYWTACVVDPIKQFKRVRNAITIVTGGVLWARNHELSNAVVAVSVMAGIVGTWFASFMASVGGVADD